MERKVTKLEHCHTEVIVNVDKDLWKKAQDKAFNKLAANITVDGFRKGKAPANLVKSRIDQGKLINEAINEVLNPVYLDILKEENIQPMARPSFEVTKYSEDELELRVVIATAPEAELGKYTGHAIGKVAAEVSDDEVNASIDELRKQNATIAPKEGQAALGDIVVIDFEGQVDGVAFEGGKAENHELELGSHSFIEGFEDQLVGSSAGIEVDVKVKFPDNSGPEEISGKDAVFHVKVNEVKQKILPELDDEFVKDLNMPNVENIDQLKDARKDQLLKQKEGANTRQYLDKLFEEIRKDSKFDIPEEILNEETENRKKDLQNRLAQSGIDMEQYLVLTRMSEEDLTKQLQAEAQKGLESWLILDTVGKKENIEVTDEEVEFEIAKLADQYNVNIDQIKQSIGQQMARFKNDILMSRIERFLVDNNQ